MKHDFDRVMLVLLAIVMTHSMTHAGAPEHHMMQQARNWCDEVAARWNVENPGTVPISFQYDDKPHADWFTRAKRSSKPGDNAADRLASSLLWLDETSGLRLRCEFVRFEDFPAIEWLPRFENTGSADTAIIANIQALDLTLESPLDGSAPYRLHRTNGAPSNPTDFEVSIVSIAPGQSQTMGGGGGRGSNKDFPFFRIETARGSIIIAVGWSGQWQTTLSCDDQKRLRIQAGLELTHFRLHPGEHVRSPRILMFFWPDNTYEANARFRELIYRHYTAVRSGEKLLPTFYCNTCFTRGGGWLNECNAENQISLIRAYSQFGMTALLTDAGWFEGGWPAGAGNWTPRKDAYPDGMAPVAAAAKKHGMIYGLWFEPERVMAGTDAHRNHPEWCLGAGPDPQARYLLDFGRKEVQDYFFNIVKGFMDLPGFRVYRQDFNMDPLAHWRYNDAPDRQGITEMKYIEGLYAYWDRIADTWPDSLRIECSSGGRRIDLETISRMHIHQKSDYWFHNTTDQASIWGLSQYLPNHTFMAPINRLDDYTFHSVLPTSMCLGWIADAPDFDAERAGELLDRYEKVKHLLIGGWYPLLPYSRDEDQWMAAQYYRRDLNEGMILVFRRPQSPYRTVELRLHGLDPEADYELRTEGTNEMQTISGQSLMTSYDVTLDKPHTSELILYKVRNR